jgi:S1-C subfamily serine protease
MNRKLLIPALLIFVGIGWTIKRAIPPKPRAKVPVVRYHGYALNRAAIAQAKSFTVLISVEGFGTGRGTGVLIDSTHVLTCAHMTEGPKDDMWIFPYPGRVVIKGRPVFVSRGDDLAILELDRVVPLEHYATFQETCYDGEPITIIGNILGSMQWFVSFGIISGDYNGFLLTDGLIKGGNSGGPWINEKGEVVAITDWGLVHKGMDVGISGGVSAKTIRAFIKRWKTPSLGDVLQMMLGG